LTSASASASTALGGETGLAAHDGLLLVGGLLAGVGALLEEGEPAGRQGLGGVDLVGGRGDLDLREGVQLLVGPVGVGDCARG
jgi:hypothetical protein